MTREEAIAEIERLLECAKKLEGPQTFVEFRPAPALEMALAALRGPTTALPNEWARVKERLPEKKQDVLMLFNAGNMAVGWLNGVLIQMMVFILIATVRLSTGCPCQNRRRARKMLQKTQQLPSAARGTNGSKNGLAACGKKRRMKTWKSRSTNLPRKYTKMP